MGLLSIPLSNSLHHGSKTFSRIFLQGKPSQPRESTQLDVTVSVHCGISQCKLAAAAKFSNLKATPDGQPDDNELTDRK